MRSFIFVAALSVAMGLSATKLYAADPSDAPATIRVALPADAVLTVDGQATQATSGTRWFTTPTLEGGKRYFYNFKASFVRDGKTVTIEQKVRVRPGRETVVSLDLPGSNNPSVAQNNQNYYYNPQRPAAPSGNVNYYYSPGYVPAAPYFGGGNFITAPYTSEWVPGNYQIYNP